MLCSPTDKLGFRLVFGMAQLTVAEFRRTLMALAEALSEPGRRFTPDQVMLKGHELNPGRYGTRFASPKMRSQLVDVSLCVLCSGSFIYEWKSRVCPFINNGTIAPVHS